MVKTRSQNIQYKHTAVRDVTGTKGIKIREIDYMDNIVYKKGKLIQHVNSMAKKLTSGGRKVEYTVQLLYKEGAKKKSHWRVNKDGFRNLDHEFSPDDFQYNNEIMAQTFAGFTITIISRPDKMGCSSKYNDCLFDIVRRTHNFPLKLNNPATFKKYLNLERKDKVPLSHIPKVEQLLKQYKINVTGDHTYTSPHTDRALELNISLRNGHATVNRKNFISPHRRKVMKLLIFNADTGETYDGDTLKEKQTRNGIGYDNYHVMSITRKLAKKYTLTEYYNICKKDIDEINELTHNRINVLQYNTIADQALAIFDYFHQGSSQPEELTELENIWLQKSISGGLIYSTKYEGYGVDSDFISFYPSIMKSLFSFPVKQGEFVTVNKFHETHSVGYGVYRCQIEGEHKLFRKNKTNYYNHIDIASAKSLGLKITLNIDGEANCLRYTRDKLSTASQLFKKYVEYLFELKASGNLIAKLILNSLWGKLCSYKYKDEVKYVDISKESLPDVKNKWTMKGFERMNGKNPNMRKIIYYDNTKSKVYKYRYARMGTFLLAKGRSIMMQTISGHEDKLVQMHTDGFIMSEDIPFEYGEGIGSLKIKQQGECKIDHCNSVNF